MIVHDQHAFSLDSVSALQYQLTLPNLTGITHLTVHSWPGPVVAFGRDKASDSCIPSQKSAANGA